MLLLEMRRRNLTSNDRQDFTEIQKQYLMDASPRGDYLSHLAGALSKRNEGFWTREVAVQENIYCSKLHYAYIINPFFKERVYGFT